MDRKLLCKLLYSGVEEDFDIIYSLVNNYDELFEVMWIGSLSAYLSTEYKEGNFNYYVDFLNVIGKKFKISPPSIKIIEFVIDKIHEEFIATLPLGRIPLREFINEIT